METDSREALSRAIASADIFALLSTAFSYPDTLFVSALLNGAFDADLTACLNELGATPERNDTMRSAIDPDVTGDTLLDALRKEYSRLFLMPGKYALIFPYESAFRHVAAGRKGTPALFIASSTKDVERRMRAFGVLPKTARQEPVDSVQSELDFTRTLYASLANALHQNHDEAIASWEDEIRDFYSSHVATWIPELMHRVGEETRSPLYLALSQTAIAALNLTALPERG